MMTTAIEIAAIETAARVTAAFETGMGAGLLLLGNAAGPLLPGLLGVYQALARAYLRTRSLWRHREDAALRVVPPILVASLLPALRDALRDTLDASPRVSMGAPWCAPVDDAAGDAADDAADDGTPLTQRLSCGWQALHDVFAQELLQPGVTVDVALARLAPAWSDVGCLHVTLAEDASVAHTPYRATLAFGIDRAPDGTVQTSPWPLVAVGGPGLPVDPDAWSAAAMVVGRRAAAECPWLPTATRSALRSAVRSAVRSATGSGLISATPPALPLAHALPYEFHLLPADALAALEGAEAAARAGVRLHWTARPPVRPCVTFSMGHRAPAPALRLGVATLLDFDLRVMLDGAGLTEAEMQSLLNAETPYFRLRDRWVYAPRAEIAAALTHFRGVDALAKARGLTFAGAMQLLPDPDADPHADPNAASPSTAPAPVPGWAMAQAGPWLANVLQGIRHPETLTAGCPRVEGDKPLKPYQEVGVRWASLLASLGIGGCLADDMGLGKTIQTLALLLERVHTGARAGRPSLLVVPLTLLKNWEQEWQQFASSLNVRFLHPSMNAGRRVTGVRVTDLTPYDLIVTTYEFLSKIPALRQTAWDLVILDEAQTIRNPAVRAAQAAKLLRAQARLALTGTPIENRPLDLWSIFDFLNPGLLGSARTFRQATRACPVTSPEAYARLGRLVRPYILRRLKSDPALDLRLPLKIVVRTDCFLAPRQIVLYRDQVATLERRMAQPDWGRLGKFGRSAAVLQTIGMLRQICNHPSQLLHQSPWAEAESGKLVQLRAIATDAVARGEKFLLFTYFHTAVGPLHQYLETVLGQRGLMISGHTPVQERQRVVEQFQSDPTVDFLVVTLKTGGLGLNLTAATRVLHFDQWWNPAAEAQATDRAYRIGQERPVHVYRFLCRGTLEERIDAMVERKARIAHTVLADGQATLDYGSLSDEDILRLLSLDLTSAWSHDGWSDDGAETEEGTDPLVAIAA